MNYLLIFCIFALTAACSDTDSQNSLVNNSAMDSSNMDHNSMDHSKIKSSPGASAAPLELQFIDTMIAHHRGAIAMAKLATGRTENRQLLTFADEIINAQEREIAQMTQLRAKWFGEKPAAVNMDFPGMRQGMDGMDTGKLKDLKGVEFDLEFVEQMIGHHEGAVTMANELEGGDTNAELKQLAETIGKDQSAEIEQMKKWQAEWSKQG